ncbi:MAG: hypothetical protein JST04_00535 [Bdellovibrionales bacterium]|nr:hypothetical protein [Bdellovibrionales bacterium]
MKFRTLILAASSLASAGAFAMPCDTGYTCTSASNRYSIEIGTCRYENSVRLLTTKIAGKEVAGAKLGMAYDGTIDGGVLAFDVSIPVTKVQDENGDARVLSIEIPAGSKTGTIKSKYRESNPAPYKLVREEAITCVSSDDEGQE